MSHAPTSQESSQSVYVSAAVVGVAWHGVVGVDVAGVDGVDGVAGVAALLTDVKLYVRLSPKG